VCDVIRIGHGGGVATAGLLVIVRSSAVSLSSSPRTLRIDRAANNDICQRLNVAEAKEISRRGADFLPSWAARPRALESNGFIVKTDCLRSQPMELTRPHFKTLDALHLVTRRVSEGLIFKAFPNSPLLTRRVTKGFEMRSRLSDSN
jgi:hypothetical protein